MHEMMLTGKDLASFYKLCNKTVIAGLLGGNPLFSVGPEYLTSVMTKIYNNTI